MSRFRLNTALVVGAMVNGSVEKNVDTEIESPMRPTNMTPQIAGREMKYRGCGMAGCRTFKTCLCRCKSCVRFCVYRGTTAVEDTKGIVRLSYASGKLITFLPRVEYDKIAYQWERMGVVLVSSQPDTGEI